MRPFTQDMIQAWMDQAGFMYFQHPTRGLLVDFRMSLKSDRAVTLRVWVSGRNKDILVMNLSSDRRIPPEDFVRALRLCNDWNQEYRWPRALVEQDYRTTDQKEDPPPASEEVESREVTHSARFCLDSQVCLSEGNPWLNSDPARIVFRSLSTFCYLGLAHRLGAGVAG
ncbi:MAG: YbjN domain-containing protein [Holophagaceae bacterium]|nr:YbjN domain-containing protein [Holophagaceae bacterium]